MIPYKITAEAIGKASSYVPIEKKQQFVEYAINDCFTTLRITSETTAGLQKVMPSMYKVNTALVSRYLMSAFVKMYLNEEYVPVEGNEWLMSQDDYNNYKSGHIFNEMNRFKSNNEIRDKIFDILSDYKELVTMFEQEIEGSLKAMNDPVSRVYMLFTELMTPTQVSQMLDDITAQKDEIERFVAEQKKAAEEAEGEPKADDAAKE